MSTPLENLRADVARLEKEDPDSWLLTQLRRQLQGYEAASAMGKTAEEIYFSGNPVVPTSSSASQDPMCGASVITESWLEAEAKKYNRPKE